MRALFATTLSLSLMACGVAPNRRSIDERKQPATYANQESNGPFHSLTGWADKVGFYVDDTAPDAVVEATIRSADTWNDALGREVMTFAGVARVPRGQDLYSSLEDTMTLVYFEKNWKATTGKADTTLATTVWENASDSDRIIKADIILNGETYLFCDAMTVSIEDIRRSDIVDAQTVMLHEFGHLLGLDHVDYDNDPDSVMHAKTFIGPQMSFRSLSEGDSGNIRQLYD